MLLTSRIENMTSIKGLILGTLSFLLLSPLAVMAQTTSDSFENSCINCSYNSDETNLTCSCEKLDGSYNTTSLYNIQPGGLDIQNINGSLQEILALPSGSYLETCSNCTYIWNGEKAVVQCSCKKSDGSSQTTTLTNPIAGVAVYNDDGSLKQSITSQPAGSLPLPAGSYPGSCGACTYTWNGSQAVLYCSCGKSAGGAQNTTLTNPIEGVYIENEDGSLKQPVSSDSHPWYDKLLSGIESAADQIIQAVDQNYSTLLGNATGGGDSNGGGE